MHLTKSPFQVDIDFRYAPDRLELSGKNELVIFALTFLTSTWYIKNPFLKAHINEVCRFLLISAVHPYDLCRHFSTAFLAMAVKPMVSLVTF
jgi:Ubiquitin elongating factor core